MFVVSAMPVAMITVEYMLRWSHEIIGNSSYCLNLRRFNRKRSGQADM
jgi:hypothetical protein